MASGKLVKSPKISWSRLLKRVSGKTYRFYQTLRYFVRKYKANTMIQRFFPISIFILVFANSLNAQLPKKAEDISPLLIGESFPNLEVTSLDGGTIGFHEVIKEKPTVLIFYRGGWCPYCTRHLSAIGQREAEVLELGYQIMAVSPDKVENLQEMAGKEEVGYRLFSDADGKLARAVGIAFQAPERYGKRLADWSGGQNTGFLPVPSVFVLNTKGEIVFEYINPDYKTRMSGELLLAVLKALKEERE